MSDIILKRITDLETQSEIDDGVYTIVDSGTGSGKKYPLGSLVGEVSEINERFDDITETTPTANLVNEANLLNITNATYSDGWYKYQASDGSDMYGQGDALPSFPHRDFKANTQYTMSFDGKYDGLPSSGFVIGFKYTDGTLTPLATFGTAERHYTVTTTAGKTVAKIYLGWNYNVVSYVKNFMVVEGTTEPSEYIPYEGYIAYDPVAREMANNIADNIPDFINLLNYESNGNLYNVYNIIRNKYINPANGQITDTEYSSFAYSPSYIPVTPGEYLCSTDRVIIAYYDTAYNVVSAMQMDNTKITQVPANVKYARFSCSSLDQFGVVVMRGQTINSGLGKYKFTLSGLDVSEGAIIVDANGSADYTSLTQAVYEHVDDGKTIIVMPGVYDVETEYVALFGQEVVDALADATTGINDFQYGIRIHDRKILFYPGAKVTCDWTGKTINSTHRFCAFRVEQGAEIDGLFLDCTATFYAIHDDYGPSTPFTISYKNCHIEAHNLFNANCIGGGCHKYSKHIIENCYFKNNVESSDIVLSADVRYHNTNTADAEPEIYVNNCYFSNNFNVAYYGNQTTKMRAYVNNCYAPKGINKVRESSSMNVDNIDLFAWNNQNGN